MPCTSTRCSERFRPLPPAPPAPGGPGQSRLDVGRPLATSTLRYMSPKRNPSRARQASCAARGSSYSTKAKIPAPPPPPPRMRCCGTWMSRIRPNGPKTSSSSRGCTSPGSPPTNSRAEASIPPPPARAPPRPAPGPGLWAPRAAPPPPPRPRAGGKENACVLPWGAGRGVYLGGGWAGNRAGERNACVLPRGGRGGGGARGSPRTLAVCLGSQGEKEEEERKKKKIGGGGGEDKKERGNAGNRNRDLSQIH